MPPYHSETHATRALRHPSHVAPRQAAPAGAPGLALAWWDPRTTRAQGGGVDRL